MTQTYIHVLLVRSAADRVVCSPADEDARPERHGNHAAHDRPAANEPRQRSLCVLRKDFHPFTTGAYSGKADQHAGQDLLRTRRELIQVQPAAVCANVVVVIKILR